MLPCTSANVNNVHDLPDSKNPEVLTIQRNTCICYSFHRSVKNSPIELSKNIPRFSLNKAVSLPQKIMIVLSLTVVSIITPNSLNCVLSPD